MTHPTINQQVTFLYTRNLEKTAHFYEEIMGLPLALDQGSCRIYQISGDAFLGFCLRETAPEKPEGIIITFATHEVDEWYRYLGGQGIEFKKPPALNSDYNIYHCFLQDPNGYLLEIQQFLDPTWPVSTNTAFAAPPE